MAAAAPPPPARPPAPVAAAAASGVAVKAAIITRCGTRAIRPASAWPEGEHGGVKVNIYLSHTFCMRDHMKVNIQTLNET